MNRTGSIATPPAVEPSDAVSGFTRWGTYPCMGGATRAFFVEVLEESIAIIEAARAEHLVIGGLATRCYLEMPLSTSEDIDVLVGQEDVPRLVEAFADRGYATACRDERWIYKAAKPDVTVDLIFRSGERIRLDDDHLARSVLTDLEGIKLRIPALEDLVVMKAGFDSSERQGRWYACLELLRRGPVDWDYLATRGAQHAPRRIHSLLLYAADDDIAVPSRAFEMLAGS